MRKNCVQQNGTPLVPLYGQFLGNLNFQEIWICRFKLGCKGARLAPLRSNWNFPSHFTMDAKLLGQHPYAQMCNPPCSLFRSADAHDNWSISFCGPVWEGPTQRHPPSVLCVEDWILAINSPLFPLSSSPPTFLSPSHFLTYFFIAQDLSKLSQAPRLVGFEIGSPNIPLPSHRWGKGSSFPHFGCVFVMYAGQCGCVSIFLCFFTM